MKKITLFAAVAVALSLASCKKDRTCTCTMTDSGGTTSYTVVVNKVTKKGAAQGACASYTQTETSNGVSQSTVVSCTVK